jgi:hypothetical protein
MTTETATTTLASLYAVLDKERKDLEERLKKHKERMGEIETQLLERFAQEGVSSIRTTDGLVHLHHQLWANCTNPENMLQSAWRWMVKGSVNSQTLSAQVRELDLDEDGNPMLPEDVRECVKVTEKWSVRVRGS